MNKHDTFTEMDAFCVRKLAELSTYFAKLPARIIGSNDRRYRHKLGQHTALMAMRSFINQSRKQSK
jgi:hypothetical protein